LSYAPVSRQGPRCVSGPCATVKYVP